MEAKHECVIGVYYSLTNAELVTLNELKQETINKYTKYTLLDYTDKRKSTNLERFDYCPYCGNKINWKEIREEEKHRIGRTYWTDLAKKYGIEGLVGPEFAKKYGIGEVINENN